MTTAPPRLPPAYRLVTLEPGQDPRTEGLALARAGADDGTLVWVRPRNDGGPDDDFRTALVLYPESPLIEACQLLYVAMLGVGDALGVLLPAGSEFVYRWPDEQRLNGGTVARFTLDHGPVGAGGKVAWVVVGMRVFVAAPEGGDYTTSSVLREEGWAAARSDDVLGQFARHFLLWVDRWLEDGFEPVRAMWMRHCAEVGEVVELRLKKSAARGKLVGMDTEGSLVLEGRDGRRRILRMETTLAARGPEV